MKRKEIDLKEFVPVKGSDNYLLSSSGKIYNIRRMKLVRIVYGRCYVYRIGYLPVAFLVLFHFLPPEDFTRFIFHKDGNVNNNNLKNLSYVPSRKNATVSLNSDTRLTRYFNHN